MTLFKHARNELKKHPDKKHKKATLEVIDFIQHHTHNKKHSIADIQAIHELLIRLLQYKPLTHLTGEPEEWLETAMTNKKGEPYYQNKRYTAIYKEGKNGKPHYTCRKTGKLTYITFPHEVT